jgi:hypothetical protein
MFRHPQASAGEGPSQKRVRHLLKLAIAKHASGDCYKIADSGHDEWIVLGRGGSPTTATAIFNRTIEFCTFPAGTTILWTIRHRFVPALDAEQVIVTGTHDFESVAFDTVGAANFIHGSDLLTGSCGRIRCN